MRDYCITYFSFFFFIVCSTIAEKLLIIISCFPHTSDMEGESNKLVISSHIGMWMVKVGELAQSKCNSRHVINSKFRIYLVFILFSVCDSKDKPSQHTF